MGVGAVFCYSHGMYLLFVDWLVFDATHADVKRHVHIRVHRHVHTHTLRHFLRGNRAIVAVMHSRLG